MQIATLGIDLAKNIFQLHGINGRGKVVLSIKVTRAKLREVKPKLPCCLIGMEACSSSN
jgi:transposase